MSRECKIYPSQSDWKKTTPSVDNSVKSIYKSYMNMSIAVIYNHNYHASILEVMISVHVVA